MCDAVPRHGQVLSLDQLETRRGSLPARDGPGSSPRCVSAAGRSAGPRVAGPWPQWGRWVVSFRGGWGHIRGALRQGEGGWGYAVGGGVHLPGGGGGGLC